jgi:hypothetical protein
MTIAPTHLEILNYISKVDKSVAILDERVTNVINKLESEITNLNKIEVKVQMILENQIKIKNTWKIVFSMSTIAAGGGYGLANLLQ